MKNKSLLLISSVVFLNTPISLAMAPDSLFCIAPYVGIDISFRHQGFQQALGGNLVSKNYPQGDAYFGTKLNNYIGFQVGYETTSRKSRTSTFTAPYIALGFPINAHHDQLKTFSRICGWHVDLVGFIPMCVRNEQFNIISSIGISKKE